MWNINKENWWVVMISRELLGYLFNLKINLRGSEAVSFFNDFVEIMR